MKWAFPFGKSSKLASSDNFSMKNVQFSRFSKFFHQLKVLPLKLFTFSLHPLTADFLLSSGKKFPDDELFRPRRASHQHRRTKNSAEVYEHMREPRVRLGHKRSGKSSHRRDTFPLYKYQRLQRDAR
jgi:hypothetical protein